MFKVMRRYGFRRHRLEVAHIAAFVDILFGIDQLAVSAGLRYADSEMLIGSRRHVEDDDHDILFIFPIIAVYALIAVIRVDPAEILVIIIIAAQRPVMGIDPADILEIPRKRRMAGIPQQKPIHLAGFVPFAEHADLIAHEVQLLARMSELIEIEVFGLREFLIVAAPHLVDDRMLAMDDLVVA